MDDPKLEVLRQAVRDKAQEFLDLTEQVMPESGMRLMADDSERLLAAREAIDAAADDLMDYIRSAPRSARTD